MEQKESKWTTIRVTDDLVEELKRQGNMGESYMDVLVRLMDELKALRAAKR